MSGPQAASRGEDVGYSGLGGGLGTCGAEELAWDLACGSRLRLGGPGCERLCGRAGLRVEEPRLVAGLMDAAE